ncbi:MAG: site-2 protease family protein [Chloroflexi bacterium]|nr:site-2 protease family protein [Chloroflexota bacterium]
MLFTRDLNTILLLTAAFIIAVACHEANHAFVATALGDDTPRRAGRLSLNPLRHIDVMGIVFFVLMGVGWGSTPVNPWKLRPNPQIGSALVAAAGPLTNLVLALLFAAPIRAGMEMPPLLHQFLLAATSLNLLLFVFNLLPIPPLDGFTVLLGVLPPKPAAALRQLERVGPGLIMVLFFASSFLGINVLGVFLGPVARALGLAGLR